MNRAWRGALLPLLLFAAQACGANNAPAAQDHFGFTTLADFEINEAFTENPLWEGHFQKTVDPSVVPKEQDMTLEVASLSPHRSNPDGSESSQALHITEEGLHILWGTAAIGDLKNAHAVDLRPFQGFSIWARSAGLPGIAVKIAFADYGSFNQVGDRPQLCNTVDNSDGRGCFDDYAAKIYPDGVWRRYDIPFASLATGGWGYPHPFDQTMVYRLKIEMLPETKYDLWFDDLAFYTDQN